MVEPESSRLGTAEIERLTPLLREVVRRFEPGVTPDDAALRQILAPVGLQADAGALDELCLWVRLLDAARAAREPAVSEQTTRALVARGVREAPAMLAVDMLVRSSRANDTQAMPVATVADHPGPPPLVYVPGSSIPGAVLRVEPVSLDFGRVRVGQVAEQAFRVFGGPARIEIEDDVLSVFPTAIGADPTTVTVRPRLDQPTFLFTRVRVVGTTGRAVELVVTADATASAPTPTVTQPLWSTPPPQPDWPAPGQPTRAPGLTPTASRSAGNPLLVILSLLSVALIVLGGLVALGIWRSSSAPQPSVTQAPPVVTNATAAPATSAPPPSQPATSPNGARPATSDAPPATPVPPAVPSAAPPVMPAPPVSSTNPRPEDRLREAEAALNVGDHPRAISVLTTLAQTDPATPGIDDLLYRARSAYAQVLLQRGEHDASYAQYEEILKARPGDPAADGGKQQVLLVKNWDRQEANWFNNPDESIRALEDVMILDREYRDARKKLYALLIARADRQAASGDRDGELASRRRASEVYPEAATSQPAPAAPPISAAAPAALADPSLVTIGVSPRSVTPGAVLTLTYEIDNPNNAGLTVVLGASIRLSGGSWIDDSSNDAHVLLAPGRAHYSRQFRVPSNALGGSYEIWQSLLDEPLKHSYAKKMDSGLIVTGAQATGPAASQSTGAPADAVRRFYAAIDAGNLQAAWNLLSPRAQGNNDYASWANGYSQTRSARATASDVSQSGDRATVAFSVISVDSTGGGSVTKRFEGTWDLILLNGQWRLDRPSVRQVG